MAVEITPSLRAGEAEEPSSLSAPARRRKNHGITEIELGGEHRVRVDCDVDGDALRRVLDALVRGDDR